MAHEPTLLAPTTPEPRAQHVLGAAFAGALFADRFSILRFGLGFMLALHFAERLGELQDYLVHGGLFDAQLIEPIAGRGLPWGQLLPRVPELAQLTWFGAAALLSLALALGRSQRICAAALLAISVETYWATYPATVLDDQMVNLTLLWLALVPLDTKGPGAFARAVIGAQLAVLLLFLMVLPEKRVVHGPFYPALLLMTVAGYLSPWTWARIAALAPAALVHSAFYAETRMAFTSVALCACTAMFLLPARSEPHAPNSEARPALAARGRRLEWGETLGACLLLVSLLGAASSAAGWTGPWHATRRLLSDLGLAPPAAHLLASEPVLAARVESEVADGEATRVLELDVGSPRQQALIALSAAAELAPLSNLRQRLAARHAAAFCRHFASYAGSAQFVVERARGEALQIAWLSCLGGQHTEPIVVLLEATRASEQTP